MKIAENIRFLARQGLSFLLATDVVIVSPGVKIGRTGYFLAATALLIHANLYVNSDNALSTILILEHNFEHNR